MSTASPFEMYQQLLDELLVRRQLLGTLSDDEEAERAEEMFEVWQRLDPPARERLETWIAEQMRAIPVQAPDDLGLVDVADPSTRSFAA